MDLAQLAHDLDQEFRSTCAQLARDTPWFVAFALDRTSPTKRSSYKIGPARVPDFNIIEWKHPLAAAYYEGELGEVFEFDGPPSETRDRDKLRLQDGRLVYTAKATARGRVLSRLELSEKGAAAVFVEVDGALSRDGEAPRSMPVGAALPDIRALLSAEQYRLITASRERPVIIQGRAGSGKTTVALYRMSWLTYAPEGDTSVRPIDPSRVLIVMFNAALRSFVQTSLEPLHLEKAQIATFHHWALQSVKKAYGGLLEVNPDVKSLPGAEAAVRLKKHLGMLRALEAFVQSQTTRARAWLVERLAPYHATKLIERFDAMTVPVGRRFVVLKGEALRERNAAKGNTQARWDNIYKVLKQGVDRLSKYKEELLSVLTDEQLLAQHIPDASRADLAALAGFQRALQGAGGTGRRPGPKVSFDDLALLLRLIQIKNGGIPDAEDDENVTVYDHVMIDEVQDFGALELRVLFDAVRSRSGVTVVGDHNQKIVPSAEFIGWEKLASELGFSGAAVTQLTVSHRSTRPVLALARTLEEEPSSAEAEGRDGPTPRLFQTDGTASLREAIVAELKQALAEAPQGHHCVVCRWPRVVQELCEWLAASKDLAGVSVRVGHNTNFVFEPGVTVTNAQQIKGLEFDSVIVVDPTEAHYPANAQGRRDLYTVITRARDRLAMVTAYAPTPLLDAAFEGGLVTRELVGALAPVTFTEDDEQPF